MSRFEYLRLCRCGRRRDSRNGALKPGDRLPPQRSFAYERKIAASTASRVYTELLRRGLVVGEVGAAPSFPAKHGAGITAPAEPRGAGIDLEFNYPVLPTQAVLIAKSLAGLDRPENLEVALRQRPARARRPRETFRQIPHPTKLVAGPRADRFHRQRPGNALPRPWRAGAAGRPSASALTYPFIKGIAARLGVTLVPLGHG